MPALPVQRTLRASPDWQAAAQQLVSALGAQPDDDARVKLLDRVWSQAGDEHYPVFVQLLCAVEQFGNARARVLLARTLATALGTARLPSGSLPAWGAAGWVNQPPPLDASLLFADLLPASTDLAAPAPAAAPPPPTRARRRVGPMEYLCAWLLHPGAPTSLSRDDFAFALQRLMSLFNAAPQAARLYAEMLTAQALESTEGQFNRQTRSLLETIGRLWMAGESPREIAARALAIAATPETDRFGAPAWKPR
ncbi:MAG: hypothetical protein KGQ67_12480 [Betaproteobacteria bacterium]|nr:hypothetical protein [Betaproteobacteria bacterium]